MALTRTAAVFTYKSSSGGEEYLWDVMVDTQGLISVRNIRSPFGLLQDALTSLPDVVVEDINESKGIVSTMLSETEADSGTVQFAGEVSKAVTIGAGVLNNANYRVSYTPPDSVQLRTEDKTSTGFTVVAASAYGAVGTEKDVAYSVLVSSAQTSDSSGTLTFVEGDSGSKTVTFTTAMATAKYRVILEEGDFFRARVVSKKRTGFTVEISHTLGAAETAVVGYDVFA